MKTIYIALACLAASLGGCSNSSESEVQNIIKARSNSNNMEFGEFTLVKSGNACIGAADTYGTNQMLQYMMLTDVKDHWFVMSAEPISHAMCVKNLKEALVASE